MLSTHRSLMRALKPTLDQRGNTMNAGHTDVCRIPGVRKNNSIMFEPTFRHAVVSAPSVSQNLGTGLGNVTHKRHKAGIRDVRNPTHSHPPETIGRMNLHCNYHDLLPLASTPSFASCFTAANIRFVHFDAATKTIPTWPNHGVSEFMQPGPSGLIASQTQNTFQPQGACPVFLTGHKPNRGEPRAQGNPRSLEDRSRRGRNLSTAQPTMQVTARGRPRFGLLPASRTHKSVRPPASQQIPAACLVVGKPFQKLLIRPRVVLSRNRLWARIHSDEHYLWGSLASSGYPPSDIEKQNLIRIRFVSSVCFVVTHAWASRVPSFTIICLITVSAKYSAVKGRMALPLTHNLMAAAGDPHPRQQP